jgi:glycerophosphoryl diester phosphodiesterase
VIFIYAHRGLHGQERENTLGAFLAAKASGTDGVELDVRRSVDGALVVHHDPSVEGQIICETRQRDLPAYIPTLEEVLEACQGMLVNVEIKNSPSRREPIYDGTGDFARQVVQHLDEGGWGDRAMISCFDQATCAFVRSFDADMSVGWAVSKKDLAGAMIQAHILGFTAVHPRFSTLDASTMDLARELALDVNVWTVNRVRDLKAVIALGVTGIITDEPTRALTLARASSPE